MVSVVSGLIGGFIGTIFMTIAMMMMTEDSTPPTAIFWSKYIGEKTPEEYKMQGIVLHLIYGIIAGGILALIISGLGYTLGLFPALIIGIVWGIILFIGGSGFWMRMVLDISPDTEMAIGFLVFHLIYGIVLGAWIGLNII